MICNDDVAREYKEILLEIGVEYSKEKTIESKDSFEFAKRFFYQGQEVSHYPLAALAQTSNKHYMFAACLIPLLERGYLYLSSINGPGSLAPVYEFYKTILKPERAKRLVNKIHGILLISHIPMAAQLQDQSMLEAICFKL